MLEQQIGNSGWMRVDKYTIEAAEPEDYLLISCFNDAGDQIPSEVAERMFSLHAQEGKRALMGNDITAVIERDLQQQKEVARNENEERNRQFFDTEIEKLNHWADDVKLGLEREISDLDAEIKLRKSEARKTSRLEEKVAAQRLGKDLEKRRSEKRRNLFDAQDEIDAQKDKLFDEVEKTLMQKGIKEETLFNLRWRII